MMKSFTLLALTLLCIVNSSLATETYLVGVDLGVQYEGAEIECTDAEESQIVAIIESTLEAQQKDNSKVIWSGVVDFFGFTFDVPQAVEGGTERARRRMSKKERRLSGAVCQSRPDCSSRNDQCLWTCGSMASTPVEGGIDVVTSWTYSSPAVNRALRTWIGESDSRCLGYKNKLTVAVKVAVTVE